MIITELPFNLPGKIFRSPMPFSYFDNGEQVMQEFKQTGVDVVVMLTSDKESQQRTKRDLRKLYKKEGLEVIYFPIEDFDIPEDKSDHTSPVDAAVQHAQDGKHVAVHCYAGLGRTGMFLALMARRILDLEGEEAIDWVRQHVKGAVQTEDQKNYVLTDGKIDRE